MKLYSTLIGDGKNSISVNGIIEAVKTAKEKNRPITLFIQAHGEMENDEHQIMLADDVWTSTRELFKELKRVLGDEYPLSVFMTACHGGGAANAAVDELPKGTIFVALSPATQVVSEFDIDRFATAINPSSWSSSEKLLYDYLTKSLGNRIPPNIVYTSNKSKLNLDSLLKGHVGHQFSSTQTAQAHKLLDNWMGQDKVDLMINKIQSASGEYDIYASEYGQALAVVLAAQQ